MFFFGYGYIQFHIHICFKIPYNICICKKNPDIFHIHFHFSSDANVDLQYRVFSNMNIGYFKFSTDTFHPSTPVNLSDADALRLHSSRVLFAPPKVFTSIPYSLHTSFPGYLYLFLLPLKNMKTNVISLNSGCFRSIFHP